MEISLTLVDLGESVGGPGRMMGRRGGGNKYILMTI